jgi:hypothetical protein
LGSGGPWLRRFPTQICSSPAGLLCASNCASDERGWLLRAYGTSGLRRTGGNFEGPIRGRASAPPAAALVAKSPGVRARPLAGGGFPVNGKRYKVIAASPYPLGHALPVANGLD